MDGVLIQFKTPSRVALLEDLDALLTAAGMKGFLPARRRDMVTPWRRAGYRLDWVFFDVVRSDPSPDGNALERWDRGLHCDVLVSRTDASKPPAMERLEVLRERFSELDQVDHDSPTRLLARYGASRRRVRRARGGSVIIDGDAVPFHRILEAPNG